MKCSQAIELLSTSKQRLLIGGLHYQGQTYNGAIVVPPKGEKVTSGQILVEMTPTHYEMTSFANGRLRQVSLIHQAFFGHFEKNQAQKTQNSRKILKKIKQNPKKIKNRQLQLS